jgi:four helix bundle protein
MSGELVGDESKRRVVRFTDLEVWRQSHELFLDLLDDIELIPPRRAAVVLIDQLVRSLGSVGANVAEGFNRSRAKYLASLDIARGEANEAENWLYKLRDGGFLPPERASAHLR